MTEVTEQISSKQIDANAEVISMLNGVMVGAAYALVIAGKDERVEAELIVELRTYVSSLIKQGITRDALGFLWSQMGLAVEAYPDNIVQNVAHYLLGCVLEDNSNTAVKQG